MKMPIPSPPELPREILSYIFQFAHEGKIPLSFVLLLRDTPLGCSLSFLCHVPALPLHPNPRLRICF